MINIFIECFRGRQVICLSHPDPLGTNQLFFLIHSEIVLTLTEMLEEITETELNEDEEAITKWQHQMTFSDETASND